MADPEVRERIATRRAERDGQQAEFARGAVFLVHLCHLPLSTRALTHVADLLRRYLKAIRPRRRVLPPGRIALIALLVLRHDQRLADMAGGDNLSATTVEALGRWGVGATRSSACSLRRPRGWIAP